MMLMQIGQFGLYRPNNLWPGDIPPEMVLGCTLWIDATDVTTRFPNANFTGTNVVTNGASIAGLTNKIASGDRGFADGTGTPTLHTMSSPNGEDAAAFTSSAGARMSYQLNTGVYVPANTLITATTKLIFACVKVATADPPGGIVYTDSAILADENQYFGLHITDTTGGAGDLTATAYNYSGGTQSISRTFSRDQFVVLTMSHQSGQLRIRINGGAWSTVASGTTDVISEIARLCPILSGTALELAHLAMVNTAQTDVAISAVEHWLALDVGITPWW